MNEQDRLAEEFEKHRAHLRAVSYRMLGSHVEADDAVQDAWLRFSQSGDAEVENLGGWLTTIVARICLNTLRSRNSRRGVLANARIPDPIVSRGDGSDPEQELLLAESVGLALQVVLDTLTPAERLAFVLHDMFDLPFEEIALIVGRSLTATRQLASRARRRVRGARVSTPDADIATQRIVVDAFFAAAHAGNFDALVAVLDPEVLLRSDGRVLRADSSEVHRGAQVVARRALMFTLPTAVVRPVLVNGAAGAAVFASGRLVALMRFTVANNKIVEIDIIGDPERLGQLDQTSTGTN